MWKVHICIFVNGKQVSHQILSSCRFQGDILFFPLLTNASYHKGYLPQVVALDESLTHQADFYRGQVKTGWLLQSEETTILFYNMNSDLLRNNFATSSFPPGKRWPLKSCNWVKENRRYLCHTDSLLFHCFMYGCSIMLSHAKITCIKINSWLFLYLTR